MFSALTFFTYEYSAYECLVTMIHICIHVSRVAILALHMAFLDRPRDPLVIAAFSLAVHNGGDMEEAIGIAKRISTQHATIYAELSDSQYLEPKALKKEVLELGRDRRE